jgi:RNA-binding protein 25
MSSNAPTSNNNNNNRGSYAYPTPPSVPSGLGVPPFVPMRPTGMAPFLPTSMPPYGMVQPSPYAPHLAPRPGFPTPVPPPTITTPTAMPLHHPSSYAPHILTPPFIPSGVPPHVHIPTIRQSMAPVVSSSLVTSLQPSPIVTTSVQKDSIVSISPVPDKKVNVYVGKISSSLSDDFLQKLLRVCGSVESWKRLKDEKSKTWKPFGFCEYQNVESALVALEVLNGMKFENNALELKTDAKTQQLMDKYKQQKIEWIAKKRLSAEQGQNFDPNAPVIVIDQDRKHYEEELQLKINQARQQVQQLLTELEQAKTENETRQSISEELAVKNTIEKIAATGAPEEETETKRVIIADHIRRFRESEKRREREKAEKLEREKRREEEKSHRVSDYRYERDSYDRHYKRRRSDSYERTDYKNETKSVSASSSQIIQEDTLKTSSSIELSKEQELKAIKTEDGNRQMMTAISLKPLTKLNKLNSQEVIQEEEEVGGIFDLEEEEEESLFNRKSKLTTLDEIEKETKKEEEQKRNDELRKRIAEIEKENSGNIPNDEESLFRYPVDWDIVDKYSIVYNLKGKIELHCSPRELIAELEEVLEEDTRPFIAKLWRNLLLSINQCKKR